jgi:hypothetical protein
MPGSQAADDPAALVRFIRATTWSRLTAGGRMFISGRTLISTRDGTRTERDLPTDDAVLAAYAIILGSSSTMCPPRRLVWSGWGPGWPG